MKRTNNFFRALSLLLCLLTVTGLFAACKIIISVPPAGTLAPPVADEAPATKAPSTTESTPTESTPTESTPGESATTETTPGESATTESATDEAAPEVRGTGAVSFCLTVTDLDGTRKEFVVKTDKKNVADALVEVGLVSGENSEYGLYIKVVNGITADYSVDGSYWSLLVNGEMSMVGASSVSVAEGLRVELKLTQTVVDPGAILFTPGAAVLPKSGSNTKSIGEISSNYAILIDAETGEILAGKDADTRFSPASMTMVMTLLVACENLKEGDLSQDVTNTEEIHNYVRAGKYRSLTVHWADVGDGAKLLDQLYGIGVVSAADCVMMVASYICKKATPAENEAAFVDLMNAEVEKMGLQNTHFDNPVGYDSENNYSTASDMAAIMMRALQCDLIREILSTQSRKFSAFGYNKNGDFVPAYNSQFYSTLFNVNGSGRIAAYEKKYGTFKLASLSLGGGKTGTLGSGSNYVYSLVSFAQTADKSKTYICVTGETSGGAEVMKDAKTIYDNYIN